MNRRQPQQQQAAPAPQQQAAPSQAPGKRPEIEVQCGEVKVSVWANDGKFSKMYSARILKVYQDNGQWKETPSIDGHLLLNAAEAFKLAWHEIMIAKGHGVTVSPNFPAASDDGAGQHTGDGTAQF